MKKNSRRRAAKRLQRRLRNQATKAFRLEHLEPRYVLTNVGLLADGTLLIEDTGFASNDVTIDFTSAGDIRVFDAGVSTLDIDTRSGVQRDPLNPQVALVPSSLVSAFDVRLGSQDDRLAVDFRVDNPLAGRPLDYDGGTQSTGGGDLLALGTGTFGTVEHRFENAHDGMVIIDGVHTISYVGLEPIDDDLIATTRIFSFLSGNDETIMLSDDADVADGESFIDSTQGESVEFTNPIGALEIRTGLLGGAGADTVNVEGVDGIFSADLTVTAEGDDTVSFQAADTETDGGDITVLAGVVNVLGVTVSSVQAPLAAGAIDFTAITIGMTPGAELLADGAIANPGDVTLTATFVTNGEADDVDPFDILALSSPTVAIAGSRIVGDNVQITADATADVSFAADVSINDSVSLAGIFATSNAGVAIDGSIVDADGALNILANANTVSDLTRVPEDDGDANDDDKQEDAAIAVSVVTSSADINIVDSALAAGTTFSVIADNSVDATTIVDGLAGDSNAGGVVVTNVVTGNTSVALENSTLDSVGDLLVSASSMRNLTAEAIATSEGATEDGDAGTTTEGQQTLSDNDASTSDGDITLAAAVAVASLAGDTSATVSVSSLASSTGDIQILSNATHNVTTLGDGSSTSGASDTGVGVAVALSRVNTDGSAVVDNQTSLTANNVLIDSQVDGAMDTQSVSGLSGDDEGADVTVAGSLAINVDVANATALVAEDGDIQANGSDVTLNASLTTVTSASATPLEDGGTGESVGVGASVALNITDHTTRAVVADGAVVMGLGDFQLTSAASHDVDTVATSAATGGTGVAAVVALAVNNEDTAAQIGTGAALDVGGALTVSTSHLGDSSVLAEGDAEGDDSAAVGAALALDFTNVSTIASTARDITANDNVAVTSGSHATSIVDGMASAEGSSGDDGNDPDTNTQTANQRDFADQTANNNGARDTSETEATPSASSSEADVSVAAAVAINVVENEARAAIEGGTIVAGGSVLVSSRKTSDAQATSDASATGADSTGVGAAVAINVNKVNNDAVVAGSAGVEADSLQVESSMMPGQPIHDALASATAGAGDADVGVAGAVAINLVDIQTAAAIETAASVDLDGGDLAVTNTTAADSSSLAAPEDGGGMGNDTGVGASFALNRVTSNSRGEVENGASLGGTIQNVTITADADLQTTTDSQNGAAGDTGVGAAVGLAIINNSTLARLGTGADLSMNGAAVISAEHVHTNLMTVGASAAGDSVGVGASVAINDVSDANQATVARTLDGASSVDLLATAKVRSEIDATASASGSDSGDADADAEVDFQRNNNPNNGGDNNSLPTATSNVSDAGTETTSESSTGSSGVGVAAVVGVNVLRATNEATVENGSDLSASGAVNVVATADVDAVSKATGTAVTLSDSDNIGAAVSVNSANVSNRARVAANSQVDGGQIAIRATTSPNAENDFISWAAAAGGGTGDIGIAGSVGINVITMTTEASSGANSHLRSTGGLAVDAEADLNPQTLAAGGGFSQGTAVGAAVAVTTIDADTLSSIHGDADASSAMQVAATATMDPNQMDLPLLNNAQDPEMTTLAVAGGVSTGDVGIAGAVVVNRFDLKTQATIASGSQINQDGLIPALASQSVVVTATDTMETTSMTGALGVSFGSVGIGAGLDLGIIRKDTLAAIGSGANVAARDRVAVQADSTEDLVTLSTNLGLADTAGIAGSASIYLVTTDTLAVVDDAATVVTDEELLVTANGDYGITSVAGALAFGSSAGIGASNVTLTHTDTVIARVGDSTNVLVNGTGGVSVTADSSEDVIATTAAGGAASTAAVAASATVVVMNETTRAEIGRNANLTVDNGVAAGQPDVNVSASDATTLVSVAGSLAASGTVAVGVGADVATVNKETRALIESNSTALVEGDIFVTADSSEDITAVAAGLSASGGVSVIVDAAVHVLNISTLAYIGDDPDDGVPSAGAGDIHANGSIVIAADEHTEMDNVVGVAAGGLYTAIATAAGIAVVDKTTHAFVGDGAQVRADGNTAGTAVRTGRFDIAYGAEALGTTGIEAEGGVGIDSDSDALSASGEVGIADIDEVDVDQQGGNDANDESLSGQRIATAQTLGNFHGIAITATNRDDIETYTLSAAGAIVGIAVSAGVNVINAETEAYVGNDATVNADLTGADAQQSVQVAAGSDFYHFAIAGSAAGGLVGVAPSVGVTVLGNATHAYLGTGVTANAKNDVAVRAHGTEDILLVGFGLAGGIVGIGGSVEVLRFDVEVTSNIGSGATVMANGDVLVLATDDTDSDIISGAVAGGLVGVGGSVGVMSIEKDTIASIDDNATVDGLGAGAGISGVLNGDQQGDGDEFATTTASGVIVQADSSEDFLHFVIAAGAGFVGVSGGVAVTLFDSDTTAVIGNNAQVNQTGGNAGADVTQSVYVNAANNLRGFSFAGGFGGGFVGVSGAVDVGIVRNDTLADVAGGANLSAAADVEINALGIKDLTGLTFSAAGGVAALNAAVSVWTVGTQLEKDYTDNDGNTATSTDGGQPQTADQDAAGQAESSRDETSSALNSYDDDAANPNNSSAKHVHGVTFMAADRVDADSPTAADINDIIDAAGAPSGTTAQVAGSAHIDAGSHIAVHSFEDLEFSGIVGGFTGGFIGIGGSVAVYNTSANSSALANGTFSSDSGDISVKSRLDENVTVTALSGQGGFVTVGAAVVVLNDTSDVQASLGGVEDAHNVEVLADANQELDVVTGQIAIAAGATGASFTRISATGETSAVVNSNAQIGQAGSVDNLDVTASARQIARAETVAMAAGGVGVSANFAFVDVTPDVEASIGSSADINVTDSVNVTADAELDAEADVLAVTGGVAAVGASITRSTIDANIQALVKGNAVIDAGNDIVVTARKNHDGAAPIPNRGARAIAEAPSASALGSGTGTQATANENSLVRSRVSANTDLTAGNANNDNIRVEATSSEDAVARGLSISLTGGIGIGATVVNATVDGTTEAVFNGNATGGGDLVVAADLTTNADADGDTASSGLLAGATGSSTNAQVAPTLVASIGDGVNFATMNMGDDISVNATHAGDADAESFGLSIAGVGVAIGVMIADANMTPDVDVLVNDFAILHAAGGISLVSEHNLAGQQITANADAASASGAFSGNGVIVTANSEADLATQVLPRGVLDAGQSIEVRTKATNIADATGDVFTGGGLAAVGAVLAEANASGATRSLMDGTATSGTSFSMTSESLETSNAHSQAVGGGGFGVFEASRSNAIVGDPNSATDGIRAEIGDFANVAAGGAVNIHAISTGEATAEGEGVSIAGAVAFGVGRADATIDTQVQSLIGQNADIDGTSLHVTARHNTDATGVPTGQDAVATSWAARGSLGLTFSTVAAPATASANTLATVGDHATVNTPGGNVRVEAFTSNRAESVPLNEAVGVAAAVGVTLANATADGGAIARFGADIQGPAGQAAAADLTVQALDDSLATATTAAAALSLLGSGQATKAISDVNPTVEANISGASDIHITDQLTIRAESTTNATASAAGFSASAGINIGGSTAEATLTPSAHADVDAGASLQVDDMSVSATHNSGLENGAFASATASGGGAISGSGATANAEVIVDLDAHISGDVISRNEITVTADSDNTASAAAGGLNFGIVGVGVSVATANIAGDQAAYLGDIDAQAGGSIRLNNVANNEADANSQSVSGGIFGNFNGNSALANIDPFLRTSIADGALVQGGDEVRLRGQVTADILATTDGVQGAGGVSIGTSTSTAIDDSRVESTIGAAIVTGSNVIVRAFHNTGEGGTTGDMAAADASSSGGAGIVGVSAATASASSTPDVIARLGGNGASVIGTQGVEVLAGASNTAEATGDGFGFGGAVGIGVVTTETTASGNTSAGVENSTAITGGGLTVKAQAGDFATSASEAAAGGIGGAGNGSVANATTNPDITSELGAAVFVNATDDVVVDARSISEADADAEGFALAGGAAGGASIAVVHEQADVTTRIGSDAQVVTTGAIVVRARHNEKINTYDGTFDAAEISVADDTIILANNVNHGLSTGDPVTYRDLDGTTIGGLHDGQAYEAIVVDGQTLRLGKTFLPEGIDASTDTITFNNPHGFESGQKLFYGDEGNGTVAGLNVGQDYFVFVVDDLTIKLYATQADALAAGESFSTGAAIDEVTDQITIPNHNFVQDQPVTYQAPPTTRFFGGLVEVSGDDDNIITFSSFSGTDAEPLPVEHGYLSGDRITYRAETVPVTGLVDGADYYVLRLDGQTLQLATDPADLAGSIVDIGNPDPDPADSSVHYLSLYQQIPLSELIDGRTYYVDVVDADVVRLLDAPGGSVVDIDDTNIQGTHTLRAAGIELDGTVTTGLHTLHVDLTAAGVGIQKLVGAGGASGLVAGGGTNGVYGANATGSAGAIFAGVEFVRSELHIDSSVSTDIGNGATLTAAGNIDLLASSFQNAAGAARVTVGGLGAFGSGHVVTNLNNDVQTNVGIDATVMSEAILTVESRSDQDASSNTRARGGGGIAVSRADTSVEITQDTFVDVRNRANLLAEERLDILADARFGGDLNNHASSGGLAIRPDADAHYTVGPNGQRQRTGIAVGTGATIYSEREANLTAQVDNAGRIDARALANAYGLFADTNADAVVTVRSQALIDVDADAKITGRDRLNVRAEHRAFGVFTEAIADGFALSDSDALVRFTADTVSPVMGQNNATFVSHDLNVESFVQENSDGYHVGYRGLGLISDADHEYNWNSARDITFDADVVLLPGANPELEIDATGTVVVARNVTVDDGHGVGYVIPGNEVYVDDIRNNDPGRARFETNDLGEDRAGVVTGSIPSTALGSLYVEHAFEEVTLLNNSSVDLIVQDILPIDRDGLPQPEVFLNSTSLDYEFNILHRFGTTNIDIQSTDSALTSLFLIGEIDNPIGTTSVTNVFGAINHFSPNFDNQHLIRSNIVHLAAGQNIGGFGIFPDDITFTLPMKIDLVQSVGRPENLTAVAGASVDLDLRGVLRELGVVDFEVNVELVSAGESVTIVARKAIRETTLAGLGDFAVTVDVDLYETNPPADDFVRYFQPDTPGDPIIVDPILGIFGSGAVEIPSTYVFDLIEYSTFLSLSAGGAVDCIDIVANIVDTTPGGGGIDWLASGDIAANFPNGDAGIGSLVSQFGDVTVTASGDIYDADGQSTVDLVGNNISLISQTGQIGGDLDDLEIDSAASGPGAFSASAAGGIYITETSGSLRLGGISSGIGIVRINAVDGLHVTGTPASVGTYIPSSTTPGEGIVVVDGQLILFTGFEPITASNFNTFTMITPNSDDLLSIDEIVPGQNVITGTSGGVAFESLSFFDIARFVVDMATNDGRTSMDRLTLSAGDMPATGVELLAVNAGMGSNLLLAASGTTNVNTDVGIGGENLDVIVSGANTRVNFLQSQFLNSLSIFSGALVSLEPNNAQTVLYTKDFSIDGGATPGSTLDLHDNGMIIDYVLGDPSPYAVTRAQIVQAFNSSAPWDGFGITSSVAQNDPQRIGVGYAEAADVSGDFLGITTDNTAVLVRTTLLGDANLDGTVDGQDFVAWNNDKFSPGDWVQADFTYDGNVDGQDFLVWNNNKFQIFDLPSERGWADLATSSELEWESSLPAANENSVHRALAADIVRPGTAIGANWERLNSEELHRQAVDQLFRLT